MSTVKTRVYKFDCGFDHSQTESCNGHTLQVEFHNTSDTVDIVIDGQSELVMSDGGWDALVRLMKENYFELAATQNR